MTAEPAEAHRTEGDGSRRWIGLRLPRVRVPRVPGQIARTGRLAGLVLLTLYSVTLGFASLERVPFPPALTGLNRVAGDAAAVLREGTVIPGPALFHDTDATPIGVLTNCVMIVGADEEGGEELVHATSTCGTSPEPSVLGGPVDKALVRLELDAIVFRHVPASSGRTSGDRIVAAIGHHYCGVATSDPDASDRDSPLVEVYIVWAQATEDRRDGVRQWVTRSASRWSCRDRELRESEWLPYFVEEVEEEAGQ